MISRLVAIRDWLGLDGARQRHPRHVELILTSTGKSSVSVRLDLYHVHRFMAGVAVMIGIWLLTLLWAAWYQYTHNAAIQHADLVEAQMRQLQARDGELNRSRSMLAARYQQMLNQLGSLENKVRGLSHRLGPLQTNTVQSGAVNGHGEGGYAEPVSLSQALHLMQQEGQARLDDLSGAVVRLQALPHGWPITRAAEITSRFGVRANPFGEDNYEFHKGLDFAAPFASPVWVTADGTVVKAEMAGPNGNLVVVDHGFGYQTAYAHLSRVLVHPGEQVTAGQVVGLLGSTGRSTGPHLHYAVLRNGTLIDPYPYVIDQGTAGQG